MSKSTQKCWLTFEGGCQDQPCLWKMSQAHPAVMFDVRQAHVGEKIGVMALQFLKDEGVRIDPVEGGSLVAG
jgi:hypothetical protein